MRDLSGARYATTSSKPVVYDEAYAALKRAHLHPVRAVDILLGRILGTQRSCEQRNIERLMTRFSTTKCKRRETNKARRRLLRRRKSPRTL